MAKKTQYGLGHTRITIPNRPDLANKTALIQVGDKTLEEALEEAGGGTTDYADLENKPTINDVKLDGDLSLNDLGVQPALVSGTNIKTVNGQSVIGEGDLEVDRHFRGWYDSSSDLPADGRVGDYAYVKGATASDPAAIYAWDASLETPAWVDTERTADTSNVQTFASGEEVNETYIDNTHLVNPKDGALPTAADVLQLKAKLDGVTASEVKATVGEQISGYINQNGVPTSTTSTGTYVVIPLNNAKSVRLLGSTNSNTGTNYSSYAFWNSATYVDSNTVIASYNWDVREGSTSYAKEYELTIPNGATHIAVSLASNTNQPNFYCYLQSGDSIKRDFDESSLINNSVFGKIQYSKATCIIQKGYISNIGESHTSVTSLIATVALNGEKRVVFLGAFNSQTGNSGYAFYDSNMNLIKSYAYPIGDISLSKEIISDIPSNAAYLKFTVPKNNRNDYYCYLISGSSASENVINVIGDISYNEILATPSLLKIGYYVKGTTGEVVSGTNSDTSIFDIPNDAQFVRFLGEDRSGTDISTGYFFYKVESIEGVDTEIPIGGNTFRQGIVASNTIREYVVEIPKGATIFKTISKHASTSNVILSQSDFYCYFGFGTNVKDYINSIEHVSLTPILPSMKEFASYMQRKSENIGMTNSEWHNPYGGRLYGFNYTTVKDLLYMTVFAASNPTLMRLIGSDSVRIQIVGKNEGVRIVTNDMRQQISAQYAELHSGATCPYRIIANKAGAHTNEDGSGVVSIKNGFALVVIAEVEGKLVAAVTGIGNTSLGYTEGRLRRVKGMVELLDICAASIRGESITGMSVTFCDKAIACILPCYPATINGYNIPIIYQQDETTVFMPASVSKVMAAIAMIDILPLNEYYEILGNPDELVNDSDYTAYAGDIQTVEDSMYAMLMASNGANTLSLARLAGERLIYNKNVIVSRQ